MSYEIRTQDLKSIRTGGPGATQYYESNREFHVNPKYTTYGDVLVSTKRVKCGISLKLKLFFRGQFYWMPEFRFGWRWGECWFHWLFFMFWFDFIYNDVVDKVVKDHLDEELEVTL